MIEAAKCILPLTQNPNIDPNFGTRHQAALGVSEETGKISIAHKGKLKTDLNYNSLIENLSKLLNVS